ncbi:MAG: PLP-dependent aminotransferase family protein [Beijerinckiaceae bacterium]
MARQADGLMWKQLLEAETAGRPLQAQVRALIVAAIDKRILAPGAAVPSTRELSQALGVARNTVMLALDRLVDQGLLIAKPRSGYFVVSNEAVLAASPDKRIEPASLDRTAAPDWEVLIARKPSRQRNIIKPAEWQKSAFPFLYGQFDPASFPVNAWRECARAALSMLDLRDWAPDRIDGDDALLIEQVRTRILPRRGVFANENEIMITLGAQHALFLLANLLLRPNSTVGIEEPGYPDARNIFALAGWPIIPLKVDDGGLVVDDRIQQCGTILVTPSHQCPTTRAMQLVRRRTLLAAVQARDQIVIEDDYESELGGVQSTPALKSLDSYGRVIYIGSFSKTVAPGLRIGYLVGSAPLVREARALRRLMLRHPPLNNQRALALFMSLGHYDAYARALAGRLSERRALVVAALEKYLPELRMSPVITEYKGGSSLWLEGPAGLDTSKVAHEAAAHDVLVEPGAIFFADPDGPRNFLRLGYGSIAPDRIEAGLRTLSLIVRSQLSR